MLEIGVHHSVAAVPAEAFQPGGMHAEIHDSFWATRSAAWSESAFVAAVCTGGWTAVQAERAGQGARPSEQPAERVAVERIAVLEVFVHHGVAAVPAEAFEAGGMHAEIHAGGQRAAFQAVAAEGGGVEPGGGGAGLHDAGDGAAVDRLGADGGRAGDAAARGGSQMRRNSGPSVRPAASCQRRSARTGQSSVVPSGRATVTPLPSRSPLESGRVRRSPRGAASRCSRRIAASSDRRSAPAKPTSSRARSRRPRRSSPIGARISRSTPTAAASFRRELAALGGVAADAGQRLADHRLGGRHRAAGEVVQIPDRGTAQVDGGDRQAALALGGEERHDVGGGRGQAGQRVAGAPGAPGGDPGAVGAPRVVCLGQPREGVRGGPRGLQGTIERRQWGGDRAIEPAAHLDRRRAERRRRIGRGGQGGWPGVRQRGGCGSGGSVVRGGHGCLCVSCGIGRFKPRQTAPDCYARQADLSGIARREGGPGHITRPLHQIAEFA